MQLFVSGTLLAFYLRVKDSENGQILIAPKLAKLTKTS